MGAFLKLFNTQTFKDSLVTISGTFVNGVLGVSFFALSARVLGPEQFGVLSFFIVLIALIADIADVGINTSIINFAGRYARSDTDKAYRYMKLGLQMKLIVWITVLVIGMAASFWLSRMFFGNSERVLLFWLAFLGVGGAMLFSFTSYAFQAFQKYKLWSVLNISMNAMRLMLVLGITFFLAYNVVNFLLSYVIVTFLGFFVGIYILGKRFLDVKGEWNLLQKMVEYNKWVALSALVAAIASRVDTFLIARFSTLSDLGNYSAANQLTSYMPQFIFALAVVVAPKLASYKDQDMKKVLKYLWKIQLMVAGLSLIGLLVLPLAVWVLPILYGEVYATSVSIFMVLFLSQLVFLISLPYHQAIFYYFSKPRIFVLSSLVQMTIVTILGIVFIERFGSLGMALAVFIGSVVNFLIPMVWVLWRLKR